MAKNTVALALFRIEDRLNNVASVLRAVVQMFDHEELIAGKGYAEGHATLVSDMLETKAELLEELSELALRQRVGERAGGA